MTDKEFDNAIKEALISDDVPEELNSSLVKKAQRKNKKAKIYAFTKFATAAAAVFICAIAVLSVYNTPDGEGMKQDLVKNNEKEEAVEIPPQAARAVNASMQAPQAMEEKAMTEDSSDSTATFNLRKALTLSDLFNEGYDFKSVINKKIKEQINALPNAKEYAFSGISDNVRFSLDAQSTLTIVFDAGEIAPSAHGEQFFTVGTAENGVLN